MLNELFEKVRDTDEFKRAYHALDSADFYCNQHDGELFFDSAVYLDNALGSAWASGLTKVVALCDSYVLKTPIMGSAWRDDDGWETEIDGDLDLCETEVEIYQLAKAAGLEHFFAETIHIEDRIYMQEKIDETFYDNDHYEWLDGVYKDMEYDEVRTFCYANDLSYLFNHSETCAIRAFLCLYELEELIKLNEFLKKFNIRDLHEFNIGWIGHDLKFIDFSGVDESVNNSIERARKEVA